MTWIERPFQWLDGKDAVEGANKLRALAWLLLIYAPLDSSVLTSSLPPGSAARQRALLLAVGCVLALLLALRQPHWRLAMGLAAGLLGASFVWIWPGNSNHRFLVLLTLGVLVFVDLEDPRQASVALASLRWMTVIVLFYTGFQKLLYGTYFHAQFLSWQVAHSDRFARVFGPLLPAVELARLRALPQSAPLEQQVYGSSAPALLLASWGTLAMELGLPFLLAWRRLRAWAVGLTVLFLVLVEAAALELTFGVVFINLVLLFAEKNWNRRLLPLSVALLGVVLLSKIGWLPLPGLN